MLTFIESLLKRKSILERTIAKAEADLHSLRDSGNWPDGHLELVNGKKGIFMYLVSEQTAGRRKYITRKEVALARALASRTYLERFIFRASRELISLNAYIDCISGKSPEKLFTNMCDARKALIRPLLVSDEVCERLWEQAPYTQGSTFPEKKIYPTKKGDMVRSKSEVLFADTYLEMGIPYRYEQELRFPDGSVLVPDFTLWDKKNRREIYHEHCGKMDDPVYRKRFLEKNDIYRRNGIYTGKNLMLTFEGDGTTLNMKEMRAMISDMFL